MPSKSRKQAKMMRAVAHGWKMPGGGGPSKEVAEEFMRADMHNKEMDKEMEKHKKEMSKKKKHK